MQNVSRKTRDLWRGPDLQRRITSNKIADALLEGPPPRKGWEEYYKL